MSAILCCRNLSSTYGKVQALNSVSIDIEPGQIVTVIGANGAGKTTLLNALSGLSSITGGEIVFEGEVISKMAIEDRVRHGICLVPERRELFGDMTVLDNLRLGAFATRDRSWRSISAGVEKVCSIFPRLQERERQLAASLSGGERQMLAFGRALMAQPRVLLLDEPSLGLAPRIVSDIFKVIAELAKDGLSVLLVEQNARAALKLASYGYVLEVGSVVSEGPASMLAENENVIEAYLGVKSLHKADTSTTEVVCEG